LVFEFSNITLHSYQQREPFFSIKLSRYNTYSECPIHPWTSNVLPSDQCKKPPDERLSSIVIKTLREKITTWLKENDLRSQILKGSASSFVIQVAFAGLSFLTSVIMARFLGADGYGTYNNATAWVQILVPLASLGFGVLIVRDVAILRSQRNWQTLKGFLRFSDQLVMGVSLFLIVVVFFIAEILFSSPEKALLQRTLILASVLIPLYTLSNMRQSTIRGYEHIAHAMLPDMVIRPISMLLLLILLHFILPDGLNVELVVLFSIAAAVISLITSSVWQRRFSPPEIFSVEPKYEVKTWFKAALPMMVYSAFQIIQARVSLVMLGAQSTADNVGFFSAAYNLAYLLIFFPTAVSYVMGPIIARLYASGEKERLQKAITQTVRVAFILSLMLGLVLIFGRTLILSIFGPDFLAAQLGLVLLCVGNLIDIALGNAAVLLSMTGQEKAVAAFFVAATVMNVVLNLFWIPQYGLNGAVFSALASLVFSKLGLCLYAVWKLRVDPTIFKALKKNVANS
jgi:O-antigen/teichoic acid export membrane protein